MNYPVLRDGWLHTAQTFSGGPKSVVLDLGVVTRVNRLVIVMAKGSRIENLAVEGSRDGGFYGLLGEFPGDLDGLIDLSLDKGMKVRTLRLKFLVPDQPQAVQIRECLVGFP